VLELVCRDDLVPAEPWPEACPDAPRRAKTHVDARAHESDEQHGAKAEGERRRGVVGVHEVIRGLRRGRTRTRIPAHVTRTFGRAHLRSARAGTAGGRVAIDAWASVVTVRCRRRCLHEEGVAARVTVAEAAAEGATERVMAAAAEGTVVSEVALLGLEEPLEGRAARVAVAQVAAATAVTAATER
jgi:hypothetical protein